MERPSKKHILKERQEFEEEDVTALLKRVKSEFTLEDVKAIIYNEMEQNDMAKIIPIFDTGEGDADSNTILELIIDAWNCFPHKTLGGKSPHEMIAKD